MAVEKSGKAASRIAPYVIIAVVGAFLLGGTVAFGVMKTFRPTTIDDCIFEWMRGTPGVFWFLPKHSEGC
jgi:hypothetical protein